MPTLVTTSTTTGVVGTNSSVVCANGNGVDFWLSGGTIRYGVSADGWGSTPGASTNTLISAERFTAAADDQDYIYLLYSRLATTTASFFIRVLTPNAGRTSWTVGAETTIHATTYDTNGDVGMVVHAEGSGWKVHCAYNPSSATTAYLLYKPVTVSSAHALTVGALTTITSDATGAPVWLGNIALGGGIGKDLAAVWYGTGGIRYRRALYSGGTLTWGTVTTAASSINSSNLLRGIYLHTNSDLDILYHSDSLSVPANSLYRLRVANGGTVTDTRIAADVASGDVAVAWDAFGNLYVYYQAKATGNAMVERYLIRSTGVWSGETVVGTSAATRGVNPSAKAGYGGNKIDVMFLEGTASPYNLVHYRRTLNADPTTPSGLSPSAGFAFDGATAQVFTATFNDADAGAYATAYADEWQENVGGAAVIASGKVPIVSGVPSAGQAYSVTRPANTLANGKDWLWRRQYWDQWDRPSPFTAWASFRTSAQPTATILSPANGATINTSSVTATWAVSDPESRGQGWYRVKFYSTPPAIVVPIWDSGWVQSATDFARTIGYTPATLTTYQIGVQVKDADGIASAEVFVTVSFNYTPPPAPTTDASANSAGGFIGVTWTTPAPTGSQPAVSYVDLYRGVGSGAFVRVATQLPASGTYPDYAVASGITYGYKTTTVGTNATTSDSNIDSDTVTFTGGMWLHAPEDPVGTAHFFQYREVAADDSRKLVGGSFQFVGRRYPVYNFDSTGEARDLKLRVALPDETNDRDTLTGLFERRTTLCFRDFKGRLLYAVLPELNVTDEKWGAWAAVNLFVVDFAEEVV